MDDKAFAAQKRRILALIAEWHDLLGLKWWTVHYEYARCDDDMPTGFEKSTAVCDVLWPYLEATITVNLSRTADLDDGRLEHTYVHECVHVLVREMRDDRDPKDGGNLNHEERVCTVLANAFIWVRDGARKAK